MLNRPIHHLTSVTTTTYEPLYDNICLISKVLSFKFEIDKFHEYLGLVTLKSTALTVTCVPTSWRRIVPDCFCTTMKLQLRDLKQQKWTLEVDPSDTVSHFKFVVLVTV
jgi:hypothetical protein